MGREIRIVPPNWEHPKDYRGEYQPMFNRCFETEVKEWKEGYKAWEDKTHKDYNPESEWWEWHGGPPDRENYVPYKKEECSWFQVYETVSEGTPVTPPFATSNELIFYLAEKGDFWDQKRGNGPWSLDSATRFVEGDGWRPSGIISNGKLSMARDQ